MSRLPLVTLGMLLPFALARGAGAVEREHELGVDVGASLLTISDRVSAGTVATNDLGPAFGIHYGYGITDQFNLLAEVQYSLVAFNVPSTDPPTHPTQLYNADVGVCYVLDVIRWVPYFGALAGGYLLTGGTLPGAFLLPGGDIVVGLDYLVTPKWVVGVEASQHFLLNDYYGNPALGMGLYTSYTTLFARTAFRWGK